MTSNFSYRHYRNVIRTLQQTGKITSFHQAVKNQPTEFIVIRHDIEFSIDRALIMAQLEQKLGLVTTYLVQIRNQTYNPFSKSNLAKLKTIVALGHHLGLHYYCDKNRQFNKNVARREVQQDLIMLGTALDRPIDIFSIHRPNPESLQSYLKIKGVINCYDRQFFHYGSGPHPVVYLSDSNCLWRYGKPLAVLKNLNKVKMQILFHPCFWNQTNLGYHQSVRNIFSQILHTNKQAIDNELGNCPVNWQ